MGLSPDKCTLSEEILSSINSVKEIIEGLEVRVGKILMEQRETEKELESMRTELDMGSLPGAKLLEETQPTEFPEDLQNIEELKRILESMEVGQKTMIKSNKEIAKHGTSEKGMKDIFKDLEKHILSRLEYFDSAKKLIEGPLVEEPPPPPPMEEIPAEEAKEKPKSKKKKGKKGKKK